MIGKNPEMKQTPEQARDGWKTDAEHFHNKSVRVKKRKFLKTLRDKGVIKHACDAANISRSLAYKWRGLDSQFADDWDEIIQGLADIMEASVYERALAGDTLLSMFWLKRYRPEFRERLNINVDKLDVEIEEGLRQLRQDERENLMREIAEQRLPLQLNPAPDR